MKRIVFNHLIVAMLVLAAFTVSCNKDEGEDEDNNGKVKLLETVANDGILELKYEYDEQDRMKKMIIYKDDGKTISKTKTFSYDNAGALISISYEYVNEPEDNYTDNFTKNGNKIIINNTNSDEEYLELDAQGLPEKWVRESAIESDTKTFEYDNNGNISKWTDVDTWLNQDITHTYIYTYTYDDKKSPLYFCKTPTWVFVWEDDLGFLDQEGTNKNNLLTINNDSEGTSGRSFTYTYDGDFPNTITVHWKNDDDTRTYTLTYITK